MQRLGGAGVRLEVAYEAGPTGYALHRQLTAHGHRLHRRGALAHPGPARRPDQDRPARCGQAGAPAAERRPDAGLGARRGPRGAARPGARPRRRQGRPAARQAPAVQVPAPPGDPPTGRGAGLEPGPRRLAGHGSPSSMPPTGSCSSTTSRSCARRRERVRRLEAALAQCAAESPHAELLAALQALRGIGFLTAVTIVAEAGDLRRFPTARQFMAYVGLVPSEHSSGDARHRGHITKTGNRLMRHVLGQAAHNARYRPSVSTVAPGTPARGPARDRRARPAGPGPAPPALPPPGRPDRHEQDRSSRSPASWPASSGRPGSWSRRPRPPDATRGTGRAWSRATG